MWCIFVQFERGEALEKIAQNVQRELEEECDEESIRVLSKAVDTVRKEVAVPRTHSNSLIPFDV